VELNSHSQPHNHRMPPIRRRTQHTQWTYPGPGLKLGSDTDTTTQILKFLNITKLKKKKKNCN